MLAVRFTLALIVAVATVALERVPAEAAHAREAPRGIRPDAAGEFFVALLELPDARRTVQRVAQPILAIAAVAPFAPRAPVPVLVDPPRADAPSAPIPLACSPRAPRAPPASSSS